MENTFMKNLTEVFNYKTTENGAIAVKSTMNMVYDMFAFGGAYRKRNDEDCILLFKNAYEENPELALKCLFYLRDVRGGQGERRFFRICYKWLAQNDTETAARNMEHLSEYGRYDDIWYSLFGTSLELPALTFIKTQLALDIESKTPSLLAKWLPSENASATETKRMAHIIRQYLNMTHREYRKTLSVLRKRINIVERLMSANEWDKIEFDKIPSKAGLIYKNAFARRDIIAKKYETFVKDDTKKVNASVLYPYEVVAKAVGINHGWDYNFPNLTDVDRAAINKYWANLPDYLDGADCKILTVIDTSGSMTGNSADAPLNVALGLGMYCAERIGGPFKDHFITFSRNPQLIKFEGVDFVDKARRVYKQNLCENTDLIKTFELLRKMCKEAKPEDIPTTIVVVSDMEIDMGSSYNYYDNVKNRLLTDMEVERKRWEADGLVMLKLVYWNVRARQNTILDRGPNVSYVSGMSPVIFQQVLTGKTGIDLMLDKLMSKRYEVIK